MDQKFQIQCTFPSLTPGTFRHASLVSRRNHPERNQAQRAQVKITQLEASEPGLEPRFVCPPASLSTPLVAYSLTVPRMGLVPALNRLVHSGIYSSTTNILDSKLSPSGTREEVWPQHPVISFVIKGVQESFIHSPTHSLNASII